MNNLLKKELYVAIHAQTAKFRMVKYAVLLPLFGTIYWLYGGEVLLKTLGVLFILAIGMHLFYRWMTRGWENDWGGYKSLFK